MSFNQFIGKLMGGKRVNRTPILLLKDHKVLNEYFDTLMQKKMFIEKQMKNLQKEADKNNDEFWEKASKYLIDKGLIKTAKTDMGIENGVLFKDEVASE